MVVRFVVIMMLLAASTALPPDAGAAKRNPAKGAGDVRGAVSPVEVGARPARKVIRRQRERLEPNAGDQRTEEPDPDDQPSKPTATETADAPAGGGGRARAAAIDEFTIFDESVVDDDDGSDVSEPTAASSAGAVLATGNWYAAFSTDDGETWTSLNPFADPPIEEGFCCDQVAFDIDHGAKTSIVWLRQYNYDPSERENALRFTVFKDADDLQDGVGSCQFSLRPQVNFDFQEGYWFDYNRVGLTNDFAYVTTNIKDADKDDKRVGALIFRIPRGDLDGEGCEIDFRYWYEKGEPYIAPVQNAASKMFLATHAHDVVEGDQLRIYTIEDSSTQLESTKKNIENFASKNRERTCTLPNGDDPCDRLHPDQVTGFRSGSTVGWLWTAGNDGEFPFPHVRVAFFETGDLDKVGEHQIRNDDFAWVLPSVGVNSRGELGVTLYAMGGGRNPRAQAFTRDDPRNWSGIQMHAIEDSTAGAPDWGDYATVRPYDGCEETFVGMVWTRKGAEPEGRAVWFGDEDDACPDLRVSAVLVLPATLDPGDLLSLLATTRNDGSGTAEASTTRYYLSRDTAKSGDDLLLDAATEVPTLAAGNQVTSPAVTAPIPSAARGTYYALACADDLEVVDDEVDEGDNCHTVQTVTVELEGKKASINNVDLQSAATRYASLHSRIRVGTKVHFPAGFDGAANVAYFASTTRQLAAAATARAAARQRGKRIGRFRVRGSGGSDGRLKTVRHRLRMPRRMRTGRLHLVACAGGSRAAHRCLVAPRRMYVAPRRRGRGSG